jgi:hypothetical protein
VDSLKYPLLLLLALFAFLTSEVQADVELPMGDISGCPFIHEDSYDISTLLETLKTQISVEINGRKSCKQEMQGIVSNLTPLQDFYKTIDPSIKQKISHSVYSNALRSLNSRKLELEMNHQTTLPEYGNVMSQIYSIESSDIINQINLEGNKASNQLNLEAFYRNQLLTYTSNILNAFSNTSQNRPECIGKMAGWQNILGTILSGISTGAGLGLNPTAQIIGAAAGIGAQLVIALKDSKIRSGYNDLIRLKNYKTLACTYYSIKRASCEYQRAFRIAENPKQLKEFIRNRFSSGRRGEYERYFVNHGRISKVGNVFTLIAHMGSPLTLDIRILSSYLAAKAVDFESLGPPPPENSSDSVIKSWLIRARAFGVTFYEVNMNSGQPNPLNQQFIDAKVDIQSKLATIESSEILIRNNLSFLDLRRRISSDFPNIKNDVLEMKNYLVSLRDSTLILATDKPTLKAAIGLLNKLQAFLDILSTGDNGEAEKTYEAEVISKGGAIFEELARGSVAQLTQQSVLALASKGTDRFLWAFGVIRNMYLNRDLVENIVKEERFGEYQKNYNVLTDVIANYNVFYGAGTTFRNEELAKSISSFEKSFYKEIIQSLKLAMDDELGWDNLRGKTAAHLCALYSPTLESLSTKGFFIGNHANDLLLKCHSKYLELGTNKLVVDKNFRINYKDECTYFTYSRETEIQDLLSRLINPIP